MRRRGRDAHDEKAGMHTRRDMDACDEEQMHSASMNKYYVESGGGWERHKKHAIRDVRCVEKVVAKMQG